MRGHPTIANLSLSPLQEGYCQGDYLLPATELPVRERVSFTLSKLHYVGSKHCYLSLLMVCCVWLEGGLFTAPKMGWNYSSLRKGLENFAFYTVTQNYSPNAKQLTDLLEIRNNFMFPELCCV